jgi:hypothetical protein
MRTLTKLLTASAAAAALVAFAPSASAAIFVNDWTVAPDGEITVTFGDTALGDANSSGVAGDHGTAYTHTYSSGTGDYTDTFDFFLPTGMVANASVSTSSLTFSSIVFDGVVGSVTNATGFHTGHVDFVPVTEGGLQHLVISGTGLATAGWGGTASFIPASVPEPATWGLMIVGFGGMGAMLRSNRRRTVAATA